MKMTNLSINAFRVKKIILTFLVMLIVGVFFNVFFIGEDFHNGIRMGKVFFLLDIGYIIIPVCFLLVIIGFRKPIDWVTILLLIFVGWLLFIGREGGIWNDEKAWYFSLGFAFFILVRITLGLVNTLPSNFQSLFWLFFVLMISVIGASEAVLGELQVFNRYQVFHNLYRVSGTFFNPAPYAGFLIASLPYATSLAFILTSRTSFTFLSNHFQIANLFSRFRLPINRDFLLISLHWVGLLSSILILAILPATQSRAAWVGLLFSGGYFFFHHYQISVRLKVWMNKSRKYYLSTFTLIFLLISTGIYSLYQFKKDSADGRLLIWKASFNVLKQNLWTGTGFDTFQAHYAPALADYFGSGQGNEAEEMLAGNVQWAFNEPLHFGVELGIPGMVLFVLLVMAALSLPVKEDWKVGFPRLMLLGARSSLLAIFVFGLFSYPFYSATITVLFFFSLAIIAGALRHVNEWPLFGFSKKMKVQMGELLRLFTKIGMIAFLTVFAFNIYGKINELKHAYWLWDEAEALYQIKAYEAANESFVEAFPFLETNGLFLQQYGKCLQMAGKYEEAKLILEQSGHYYKDDFWYLTLGELNKELGHNTEAEKCYRTASMVVPHKLYPKYLLAKLYEANGQQQQAIDQAHEILSSDIKVMSTAVKEIQQAMREIVVKNMGKLKNEERQAEPENANTYRSLISTPKGKEVQR